MTEDDVGDPALVLDDLPGAAQPHGVEKPDTTAIHGGDGGLKDQEVGVPVVFRTTDLGRIATVLSDVIKRLDAVEQAVALRDHADGRDTFRDAAREFGQGAVDLARVTSGIVGHVVSARQRQQRRRMFLAGAIAGLVSGILALLFAPRMLPGQVETAIVSTVMGERWRNLAEVENFARSHKEKLALCTAEAARTMQNQLCTLLIPAPRL